MRTNPRPTPESIGACYPEEYAPHSGDSTPAPGAPGIAAWLTKRLRLDGTRTLVPSMAPGRALEIGCASGAFLSKLARRGWTVFGVEPSRAAADRARKLGFPVHVGPLETAPAPEQPFDLVTASHAFEHLHEPLAAFEKLRGWSAPDAWLTCSVPDSSSSLFSKFKSHWYDLDLPRHLFHFSPKTLSSALDRCGWRVVKVRRVATLNGVAGTLGNIFAERGWRKLGALLSGFPTSPAIFREPLTPIGWLAAAFGMSGRMVLWSRRR
ncbi:MAG TPA: class I SAM-dependent methyltransferase [Polyangia bacterium]|nr:class I SAM-dependent methyltransferase [Polyangia bacterium]